MAYSNKPVDTLAEKVGPWLDHIIADCKKFGEETKPIWRMACLSSALQALNAAQGIIIAEFTDVRSAMLDRAPPKPPEGL